MALKNAINYARFFVQDSATGLGVAGLTVGAGSFTSIKLCQDAVLGDDIKATISLIDCATGWYGFALSAAQMNKSEVAPVVVPATATYQAYGVTIYTEQSVDLSAAIAELAADPGATPTLVNAVMLLYMKARNAETVTATAKTVKNSAGTTVLTHTLSDDATTFTKSKVA
jgi:hypothetical protein